MRITPINYNYLNNNYKINNNIKNKHIVHFTGDKAENTDGEVFAKVMAGCAAFAAVVTTIGCFGYNYLAGQSNQAQENPNTPFNDTSLVQFVPSNERTPEYHNVKSGDTLSKIVKHYAQLPDDYPNEMLEPYYLILENDNPNAWEDRNIIKAGITIRVDGICPENVYLDGIDPAAKADETEENDIRYEKVTINELTFTFDIGTVSKEFLGRYEGRENGKFKTIDKTLSGDIIVTNYLGSTPKDGVKNEITYNKEGQIIKYGERDPKGERYWKYFVTYEYTGDTLIETLSPDRAISDFYRITTKYDREEDIVFLKEFSNDEKVVARVDFISGIAEIGGETWIFDEGTFKYNKTDDEIGYYSGTINGQRVIIEPSKSGFSVQFFADGEVETVLEFNTDGEKITPKGEGIWPWQR
ncbi:MAG: hypothetical protein IKU37_08465 [Candidatus Gastranaerophilales bacterium]|nr:hypothetical protein [Candidatus Gastranaerophilales bacterium]